MTRIAALVAGTLALVACTGATPLGRPGAGSARTWPIGRVDAVEGRPLVVPLPRQFLPRPGESLRVKDLDGESVSARVVQLVERPTQLPDGPLTPAVRAWLGDPVEIRSMTLEVGREPAGTCLLILDQAARPTAPSSTERRRATAVGDATSPRVRTLSIGGVRVPVQVLPAPGAMASRDPTLSREAWTSPLPQEVAACTLVRAMLQRERADPRTRWRYLLATAGLDPTYAESVFPDPVVEALAVNLEDRWRIALARLHSIDPGLSRKVASRLCRCVKVSEGLYAPAWPTDESRQRQLLEDLLNPDFAPQRRVELAEHWLEEQPGMATWVVDDAGTLLEDASSRRHRPWTTLALANLSDRECTAWLSGPGLKGQADLHAVAPDSTTLVLVPIEGEQSQGAGSAASASAVVRAHCGEDASDLRVLCGSLPVAPPGLTAGPFAFDLSITDWQVGGTALPEQAWRTAALLHAATGAAGLAPHRRWELYVECRAAAGADLASEYIDVCTGPFGSPTGWWRITPDGAVRSLLRKDEEVREEVGGEPSPAKITRTGDRWTLRVSLPPGAIEAEGLVRLGLVRMDALGRRSSWPRAIPPWQGEPSRALLDTSAWTSGR